MKKALIIGANGGIGHAALNELYPEYEIFATAIDEPGVESIKQNFPEINALVFDHMKREEKEFMKKLDSNIDCLIIASGITSDGLSIRLDDQLWDKTIEINLSSVFRLIKHAYMRMNRGGTIILLSSVIASMGNIGQVAYAASKGGLEAMVRTLAREYASKGITINAIAPGFVDTKMTQSLDLEEMKKNIPLGRICAPSEIAFAIKFLADERSRYITGHILNINGGLWM